MTLDMTKLEPLLGKVVNDIGAASNAALVILGDKLGLFRALAERAKRSELVADEDCIRRGADPARGGTWSYPGSWRGPSGRGWAHAAPSCTA